MNFEVVVKTGSSAIALLSSFVALYISWQTAMNYTADREAKSRQEDYQNQMSIIRIYFERISGNFCKNKQDAVLLVRAAQFSAQRLTGKNSTDEENAVAGLAKVMMSEFEARSCAADAAATSNTQDVSGIATVAERQKESTYAAKEVVASNLSLAEAHTSGYTVYIQYRQDFSAAQRLQGAIDADSNYVAAGIERLESTPVRDEIRIYKDTPADRAAAQDLATRFLPDARIVSLAKAYPKLRTGTIEIWLSK